MYQNEWWSRGRTREEVERLLAGPSLIYALVEPASERLAAFARVVTDGVFKAWLFDVMVAPAWRGRGFGRALLQRVIDDPRLVGVAHLELYCAAPMAPFYQPLGFAEPSGPLRLLRRTC
jgi:GNAT superfamily N-acetyltransferase